MSLVMWFSPTQFGTWWSVLSASANISGGLSPFFTAFLILNYGWRFSLFLAGSVSVGLGFIALVALVNSPVDVDLPSFAVTTEKKDKGDISSSDATVGDLLKCPALWLVSFCYMVVFCAKTATVDWGQLYLLEDRKHTQYVASAFTSSVESGGFLGGILAGYLTDLVLKSRPPNGLGSNPGKCLRASGFLGTFHPVSGKSLLDETTKLDYDAEDVLHGYWTSGGGQGFKAWSLFSGSPHTQRRQTFIIHLTHYLYPFSRVSTFRSWRGVVLTESANLAGWKKTRVRERGQPSWIAC
ncbi:glucose-6-phosphate exchanger SLC37A4 [Trichonephila clavipes]|nr:glucose-6-phosphate exchanger SLC37A4 [Trichonephila clavipes]